MMSPRAVVIVHGEALVAEGLAEALGRFPALVPLGAATNAGEGERLGRRAHAVAVDERVPGAAGLAKRLRGKGVRVVLMGEGNGDDGGAFVSTHAPMAQLALALAPDASLPRTRPRLTKREAEVLRLIRRGVSGKQIARLLGISPKTVENHKARIYSKLGVPNQTAAAAMAVEMEGAN